MSRHMKSAERSTEYRTDPYHDGHRGALCRAILSSAGLAELWTDAGPTKAALVQLLEATQPAFESLVLLLAWSIWTNTDRTVLLEGFTRIDERIAERVRALERALERGPVAVDEWVCQGGLRPQRIPLYMRKPENRRGSAVADAARDHATRPKISASASPHSGAVEAALAEVIRAATSAERWDVVAQLAGELEARRLARAGNVVALRDRRTMGTGKRRSTVSALGKS